ncbi:hypothetical protein ACFXHA_27970 [Nocardia sp. NPDC059240]|uniref:hypothetical protein n=1 Tax=Nocardia sp. NPDC059240 TaxID=3346786 RepID=UPI0036C78776
MPKHLITLATLTAMVAVLVGCSDHRSTPLTPPTTTAVPMLGGGQIPDVIDVPTGTTTPASTTTPTTTTTATTTATTTPTTTTATPRAAVTQVR